MKEIGRNTESIGVQIDEKELFNVDGCTTEIELTDKYTLHGDCENERVVIEDTTRENFSYVVESKKVDIQVRPAEYLSDVITSKFNYVLSILSEVKQSKYFEIVFISDTIDQFEIVVNDYHFDSTVLFKIHSM